ncbi:MAG: nucleoside deaminase [Rickettsiaceae bacterium]
MQNHFDNQYMQLALEQANKAYAEKEIPVGCIIVQPAEQRILAQSHNMSEQGLNPNLHAEMMAIDLACQKLQRKNLSDCEMYVTLEPCVMCASAISNSRIKSLYYGALDRKQGAIENGIRFFTQKCCFHKPEVYSALSELQSAKLMKKFFVDLRKK